MKNNQRLIIAKVVVKNFNLSNKIPRNNFTKFAYETPAKTTIIQQEILKNLARKIRKNCLNLVIDLSPGDNVSLSAFAKEELFTIGIDEKHFELLRLKRVIGNNKYIEFLCETCNLHFCRKANLCIFFSFFYIKFINSNWFNDLQWEHSDLLEVGFLQAKPHFFLMILTERC